MDWDLLLRVGQIVLAAVVATVPPFYPRRSLFVQRAENGIEFLRALPEPDEGTEVNHLRPHHTEFGPITKSISQYRPLEKNVRAIGFATVETRSQLNDLLNTEYGACLNPCVVLFVEFSDDTRRPVIFHPFDHGQTWRLTELREWVKSTAIQRSNYLTAVLAVIWTALAVASAF